MNKINFSLIALVLALNACHSAADEISARTKAAQDKANSAEKSGPDGGAIFRQNCITCHGADGKLGLSGAKDLSVSELPLDSRIQIITNGKNLMTPFKALLNEAEIKAVAEYTLTLRDQTAK